MQFTNFYNQDLKNTLDENFSNIVTENVGPFIYSTIKTIRPKKILEIGAGYTSIFFGHALKEIEEDSELEEPEGTEEDSEGEEIEDFVSKSAKEDISNQKAKSQKILNQIKNSDYLF